MPALWAAVPPGQPALKREDPPHDAQRPAAPLRAALIPRRLRAEIMLRQDGRCVDCGTRLILGFFVFDPRPALALRSENADANEPERLAAICWSCDQAKTPRDLKEIARAKRLATKHQDFLAGPLGRF